MLFKNLSVANETILKQRRLIASKRANASRPGATPVRELDENQRKEIYELQEQSNTFHRELRTVQAKLSGLERETKSCAATSRYINTVPTEAPLYRAVGKTFILTPRSEIETRLTVETEQNMKAHKDLTDKKEFLDRRITSVQQDMKAIITGV